MADDAPLFIEAASALAIGARERQEDALALAFHQDASDGFAVLSDGMGGHSAGDVASRIIVAEIFAELTLHGAKTGATAPEPCALLHHAVKQANATLGAHASASPKAKGLGGTVVATTISDGRLHWISVGDSPLYLFRNLTLTQLNADHSMAPQIDLMAERGMMTPEEAQRHPDRNVLTSALIGTEIGEVDCPKDAFSLKRDDVLIVASDGLQFLPDPVIEAVLVKTRNASSGQIAQALLDAIGTLKDPSQDNVSLVVMRVTAPRQAHRSLLGKLSKSKLAAPWRQTRMPDPDPANDPRDTWTAR